MKTTKQICTTALGIALYVCVSMTLKIPTGIGHLSLDLGYLVLAAYCYLFGCIPGAITGCAGAFLVSVLASGWMGPEWPAGNLFIGFACGFIYRKLKNRKYGTACSIFATVIAVFIGICLTKTSIEIAMYGVVPSVKFLKNLSAFAMDAIVMSAGVPFAKQLSKRLERTPGTSIARGPIKSNHALK